MCGRFWTISDAEWAEAVDALRRLQERYPDRDVPRGLIVPTLPAAVIAPDGLAIMTFSYKNPYDNKRLINARAETVLEKPTFSSSMKKGLRCIVPASAFHEPSPDKKGRRFTARDGGMLRMAALYRPAGGADGEFVIITRQADAFISPCHDRMPLLLSSPELCEAWLRSDTLAQTMLELYQEVPLDVDLPA